MIHLLLLSHLATSWTAELKRLDTLQPSTRACALATTAAHTYAHHPLAAKNIAKKALKLCANHDADAAEHAFRTIRAIDSQAIDSHCVTYLCLARARAGNLDGAVRAALDHPATPPRVEASLELLSSCCAAPRPDLATALWNAHARCLVASAASTTDELEAAAAALCRAGELGVAASIRAAVAESGRSKERLERTLAVLKPGAVGAASSVLELIESRGLRVVRSRRWRMSEAEAEAFVRASWGTTAGDGARRFFREMVHFYASDDVLALVLEGVGAIRVWRELLGPGDPSVARRERPESVRALFGTNKLANGAHGADSPAAATRELACLFPGDLLDIDGHERDLKGTT